MRPKANNPVEVDLGNLDLRYAHTRVAKPKLLDMLTTSIERYGQITPVFIIPEQSRFVLIDGYVRVGAIKRLGRDTIIADVHEIPEQGALFHLLGESGQRQWEAVEQAWIIRDLKERFGCSLREIARGIGYDASWVTRRLSLIDGLPDEVLKTVSTGHVSTYAATRILVPLARANRGHAEKLVAHLAHSPLSTRELSELFKHYEASNKQIRERMISDPSLFLKVRKSREDKTSVEALQQGPEGAWVKDWEIIKSVTRRLTRLLPTVIYPGQDKDERIRLLRAFRDIRVMMDEIEKKISQIEEQ
jgi:ParB family transcriptional regulator, chromosome partitioning protein